MVWSRSRLIGIYFFVVVGGILFRRSHLCCDRSRKLRENFAKIWETWYMFLFFLEMFYFNKGNITSKQNELLKILNIKKRVNFVLFKFSPNIMARFLRIFLCCLLLILTNKFWCIYITKKKVNLIKLLNKTNVYEFASKYYKV